MTPPAPKPTLDLDSFFPYQLAVLAQAVSLSMAQIYARRFDLSRDEWRVLAALSGAAPVRTAAVIERATLDKLSVSRALRRMVAKGLVERTPDPEDGRGYLLRLRPPGRALLRQVVPMVRAREDLLLETLSAAERKMMQGAFDKLLARARQLARQDY